MAWTDAFLCQVLRTWMNEMGCWWLVGNSRRNDLELCLLDWSIDCGKICLYTCVLYMYVYVYLCLFVPINKRSCCIMCAHACFWAFIQILCWTLACKQCLLKTFVFENFVLWQKLYQAWTGQKLEFIQTIICKHAAGNKYEKRTDWTIGVSDEMNYLSDFDKIAPTEWVKILGIVRRLSGHSDTCMYAYSYNARTWRLHYSCVLEKIKKLRNLLRCVKLTESGPSRLVRQLGKVDQ
jgi:hypothetical protein